MVIGGMSFFTNEPAPIIAPSPMVTLGITMAPVPNQAFFSIIMGPFSLGISEPNCLKRDLEERIRVTLGDIDTRSPMVNRLFCLLSSSSIIIRLSAI